MRTTRTTTAKAATAMMVFGVALAACSPGDVTKVRVGGAAVTVQTEFENKFDTCADARDHYQERIGGELEKPIPFKLYRVIPPNSAVTMDYNPERLNIYTDEGGVITKVTCG